MNAKFFSALSRNVGQLRRMKKAHEDMGTDIAVLKLENSELRPKLSPSLLFRRLFISNPFLVFMLNFG